MSKVGMSRCFTWGFPGSPPWHCLTVVAVRRHSSLCVPAMRLQHGHVKGLKGAVVAQAVRQLVHDSRGCAELLLLHCWSNVMAGHMAGHMGVNVGSPLQIRWVRCLQQKEAYWSLCSLLCVACPSQ